jgi:hypothetical protein
LLSSSNRKLNIDSCFHHFFGLFVCLLTKPKNDLHKSHMLAKGQFPCDLRILDSLSPSSSQICASSSCQLYVDRVLSDNKHTKFHKRTVHCSEVHTADWQGQHEDIIFLLFLCLSFSDIYLFIYLSCEYCNEPPGFMKCREFLDYLRNC